MSKRTPETTHADLLSEFIRDADAIQGHWQMHGPTLTETEIPGSDDEDSDDADKAKKLGRNLDNLASLLLKSPLNGRWADVSMTPFSRMREGFNKSTIEDAKAVAVILLAKFREGDDREENAITMMRAEVLPMRWAHFTVS